jgi:hypothetical protein
MASIHGVNTMENTLTGSNAINFNAANSNSIYGASTTVSVSSKTVRFIIKY